MVWVCLHTHEVAVGLVHPQDAPLCVVDQHPVGHGLEDRCELGCLLGHLPLERTARRHVAGDQHRSRGPPVRGTHRRARDADPEFTPIQSPHAGVHCAGAREDLAAQHAPLRPLLWWQLATLFVEQQQALGPFFEWEQRVLGVDIQPQEVAHRRVGTHKARLQIIDAHAVGLRFKDGFMFARLFG